MSYGGRKCTINTISLVVAHGSSTKCITKARKDTANLPIVPKSRHVAWKANTGGVIMLKMLSSIERTSLRSPVFRDQIGLDGPIRNGWAVTCSVPPMVFILVYVKVCTERCESRTGNEVFNRACIELHYYGAQGRLCRIPIIARSVCAVCCCEYEGASE